MYYIRCSHLCAAIVQLYCTYSLYYLVLGVSYNSCALYFYYFASPTQLLRVLAAPTQLVPATTSHSPPPLKSQRCAPVPAPMVALQKGTIKICPHFCHLVRSRRRGPDQRTGWNLWGGGSRGFPSGQPLCRSLRKCHHCRRPWDNSGGRVRIRRSRSSSSTRNRHNCFQRSYLPT